VIVRAASLVVVAIVGLAALLSAQGGGKPATGNPTPGTEQPAPPNVADRVTVVGCLQSVAPATTTADSNTPSNSRFELAKATSADTKASSKTYRLEGIDSQFSPFVGSKAEITGEIKAAAGANPPTLLVEFVQRIAAKCS
jgi:hypothetical protein